MRKRHLNHSITLIEIRVAMSSLLNLGVSSEALLYPLFFRTISTRWRPYWDLSSHRPWVSVIIGPRQGKMPPITAPTWPALLSLREETRNLGASEEAWMSDSRVQIQALLPASTVSVHR